MSELGQLLRNARIEKKISLDDLQETTKIRKRYLEAIEEGNYKVLPGSFYVRAFIKSYAETVGLDPNEVLRLYNSDIPAVELSEPVAKPLKRARASSQNADRISRWVSNIVMVSFVLLILGALYFYFYNNAKTNSNADIGGTNPNNRITDSTPPAAPPGGTATGSVYGQSVGPLGQTPSAQAQAQTPAQTPAAQGQTRPPGQPAQTNVKFVRTDGEKNVDYYAVTGSAKLELQLKVTSGDCWYQLDSLTGGIRKMIKQEQKSSGYSNSWSLDSSAFLRVGKADAVEITINGTVIPAGTSPNPKNIQIDLQPS